MITEATEDPVEPFEPDRDAMRAIYTDMAHIPKPYRRGWALWSDSIHPGAAALRAKAEAWIDKFYPIWPDAALPRGLWFRGVGGSGKSLLAACIAGDIAVAHPGRNVRWTYVPDIFSAIDSTRRDGGPLEEDIMDYYANAGLLVLDDLGTERPTHYAVEKLLQILERRFSRDAGPIIVTTNYAAKQIEARWSDTQDMRDLGHRLLSRLSSMVEPWLDCWPNKDLRPRL